MSRAIGDFEFKKNKDLPAEQQIVTALPDVEEHKIGPDDEFLVVACDGEIVFTTTVNLLGRYLGLSIVSICGRVR